MIAIVNRAYTNVTALGGGVHRIAKTGGFDGSFDAAAVSVAGIAGDFAMRARRVGASGRLMIGVSANPDEDTGYMGLDYALEYTDGVLEIFERGNYRAYNNSVESFVWIERIGTTLNYKCGPLRKTSAVMRSVTNVSATLFFDSSLVTPGVAVDVRFEALGTWTDPMPPMRHAHFGQGLAL
jgi:hypothetical protein